MSVYQLLQMLPERRESGRGLDELLDEIGLDSAHVRRTKRWIASRWSMRFVPWSMTTWRDSDTGVFTLTSTRDADNFAVGMRITYPSTNDPEGEPHVARVESIDYRAGTVRLERIARTPAGRALMLLEWAQAGVISAEECTRLMEEG